MIYISNSFSLNMLPSIEVDMDIDLDLRDLINLRILRIDIASAIQHIKRAEDWCSAIGHQDTANVVSKMLGIEVPAQRLNIKLCKDDVLIVAQYRGPRLPEGATELPEKAKIEWFKVSVG